MLSPRPTPLGLIAERARRHIEHFGVIGHRRGEVLDEVSADPDIPPNAPPASSATGAIAPPPKRCLPRVMVCGSAARLSGDGDFLRRPGGQFHALAAAGGETGRRILRRYTAPAGQAGDRKLALRRPSSPGAVQPVASFLTDTAAFPIGLPETDRGHSPCRRWLQRYRPTGRAGWATRPGVKKNARAQSEHTAAPIRIHYAPPTKTVQALNLRNASAGRALRFDDGLVTGWPTRSAGSFFSTSETRCGARAPWRAPGVRRGVPEGAPASIPSGGARLRSLRGRWAAARGLRNRLSPLRRETRSPSSNVLRIRTTS